MSFRYRLLLHLIIAEYVHSQCSPTPGGLVTSIKMVSSANKQLSGHQIKTSVTSSLHCGILCKVTTGCLSFNYGERVQECQLNDADADMYPCHLLNSDDLTYYGIIPTDGKVCMITWCYPVSHSKCYSISINLQHNF